MIATGHSAIGFGIGVLVNKKTNNHWLAGAVGFSTGIVLHYITDFIPHGHIVLYTEWSDPEKILLIFLDAFLGAVIFLLATYLRYRLTISSLIVIVTILGSLLPDIIDGLLYYSGNIPPTNPLLRWEFEFHKDFLHWHGGRANSLPIGWYDLWQLIIIFMVLYLSPLKKLLSLKYFQAIIRKIIK